MHNSRSKSLIRSEVNTQDLGSNTPFLQRTEFPSWNLESDIPLCLSVVQIKPGILNDCVVIIIAELLLCSSPNAAGVWYGNSVYECITQHVITRGTMRNTTSQYSTSFQ